MISFALTDVSLLRTFPAQFQGFIADAANTACCHTKDSDTGALKPGKAQGAPKNVPSGPANTGETVETVKRLRDPDATPLKRGVNEMEPAFSSAPWRNRGNRIRRWQSFGGAAASA